MTVTLHNISPVSWQHPTDKVATNALARIPGIESLLRRLAKAFGDRAVERFFQGAALEVTPVQFGGLHELLVDACRTLDTDVPRLFVSESPYANAGAVGLDTPFIVIHSRLAELATDDELRFVLGHEVGHIMAGHAVYRTIAVLLTSLIVARSPVIAVATRPIVFALNEWSRKIELSSDRAGLLACQDVDASLRVFARTAGGLNSRFGDMNLEAVLAQSDAYMDDSGIDRLLRHLSAAPSSHPLPMVRIAEIRKWIATGEYHQIIDGDYPKRPAALPVPADLSENESQSDEYESGNEAGFSETASQVFTDVDTYVTKALNDLIDRISDWQDRSRSGSQGSETDAAKTARRAGDDDDPLDDYLDNWPMPQ